MLKWRSRVSRSWRPTRTTLATNSHNWRKLANIWRLFGDRLATSRQRLATRFAYVGYYLAKIGDYLAIHSRAVGDQLAQLAKIGDRLATVGDPFGDISPNDCAQIGSGLHKCWEPFWYCKGHIDPNAHAFDIFVYRILSRSGDVILNGKTINMLIILVLLSRVLFIL